ncbi:MAG: DUF2322 family protein [Gammaproteobacteria bacterium]|nr:DUF2322 family protein [Gammaproteobacteria bacterium]
MPPFAENLKSLPAIDHIERLDLYDGDTLIDTIENMPGKAGSVAVYHALLEKFGGLNPDAAAKGLTLYAEHTADAAAHPGKHPNIDRLFAIIARGAALRIGVTLR